MHLVFFFLPLLAGITITTQAGVNSQLRASVGSPLLAAFISFVIGTMVLCLMVLLTGQSLPSWQHLSTIDPHKYTGGVLGAIFVTIIIVSAQRISAGNLFALVVAGQLITALIYDHYGLLGFKQNPVNLSRVLGALLLVIGAYLVNRK